jgi:hypothetical protein
MGNFELDNEDRLEWPGTVENPDFRSDDSSMPPEIPCMCACDRMEYQVDEVTFMVPLDSVRQVSYDLPRSTRNRLPVGFASDYFKGELFDLKFLGSSAFKKRTVCLSAR